MLNLICEEGGVFVEVDLFCEREIENDIFVQKFLNKKSI